MQFKKYDISDLETCGKEFVDLLKQVGTQLDSLPRHCRVKPTQVWTEFVLDWFAATAPDQMTVDAHRRHPGLTDWERFGQWDDRVRAKLPKSRDTRGEFLVDLAHTTYPRYDEDAPYDPSYYPTAIGSECRVKLALESEWGFETNPRRTLHAVLEDAAKLAALRADVKVISFGPPTSDDAEGIIESLRKLRKQADDEAPWLWISIPWSEGKRWRPESGVFSE